MAQTAASPNPEFRSLDEFRKHYYPRLAARPHERRDICVAAEQLATRTIRSVRKQLAAR